MAGAPTPNYNFPTYAETDAPDLAGAYNQAVNAIDAKIKEVADSVSTGGDVPDANSTTKGIAKLYDSASLGDGRQDDGGVTPKAVTDAVTEVLGDYALKFTATAPVTYSGNKIGIRYSNPSADGAQNGYGAVQVTGKQQDVANADSLTTATVPNVKAVKDYVDAKVPVEQQAYTGTAPITVDNGSHTIGVNMASAARVSDDAASLGQVGVNYIVNTHDVYAWVKAHASDVSKPNNWAALYNAPVGVGTLISVTPDASTSAKGLVQLTTSPASADSTMAVTGSGVVRLLSDRKTNATTNVTVDMLKNLYVDTATGVVYYKAPSE